MRAIRRRSTDDAACLIARVRPLWPVPRRVRVGRGPWAAGSEDRDYLVLPALRVPILLVPAGERASAAAISRFGVGQRARVATAMMAWAHARGLLRWAPTVRLLAERGDDAPVLSAVAAAVPEAIGVVVWLGRHRHGRAIVLNAFAADGSSLAYAKCAWGSGRSSLRAERDHLVAVSERPIKGVRAPRVQAFTEAEDFSVLVIEALGPGARSGRNPRPPVAEMRALAGSGGWESTSFGQTPVVQSTAQGIAAVAEDSARRWLSSEFDRFLHECGSVVTSVGCWHGDWVAWNMIEAADEVLLWDWEHFYRGVPPGWDHLHFLAQDLRRHAGTGPQVEDRWLALSRRALADDWGVHGAEAEAVIRSYLLWVNLRYVADREGDPAAVPRSGWTRELLARLGEAPVPAVPATATPRPLRILHVSEVHWGGVVTLLQHFVSQQVEAGHEVHVLAPDPLFSTKDALDERVTTHRWSVRRADPVALAGGARQLRRLVAELQPDVVHLHSFFAGMLGRLPGGLSGLGRSAVVYQPHAWSDKLSPRASVTAAVRSVERRAAGRTSLLVANCRDELNRGTEFGVTTPGRPIGVTVDLERFRPPTAQERQEARAALGLDDQRVALVLGRLARQKGQDLLLPAWERDHPGDTVLALVGPGDVAFVQGPAGQEWGRSVIAPGGTDDVRPWLWAADVLVLSSRYETVALVVAEAMATGLPVVSTAVDGVREVLLEGDEPPAGAVVALDDMAGLVREVSRRLDDAGLHAAESAAGPLRAQDRFAPAAVAGRLEAAYREAIEIAKEP